MRRGPRMMCREDVGSALDVYEFDRLRADLVARAEAKRRKRIEQERAFYARKARRRDRRRSVVAYLWGRR